jgi:hypothetical protein
MAAAQEHKDEHKGPPPGAGGHPPPHPAFKPPPGHPPGPPGQPHQQFKQMAPQHGPMSGPNPQFKQMHPPGPSGPMGGHPPGPSGQFSWHGHEFHQFHPQREFVYPPGWAYRQWTVGAILPPIFLVPDYYFTDWVDLGLPPPPPGAQYVRYGPDLLLVDVSNGQVIDVIPGVFY